MDTVNQPDEIIAVIDIGSSAIRLLIARKEAADWQLLDSAEQPLALGRDVFRNGSITHSTVKRAIEILSGFQELMAPYKVNRIEAIGTSALRESDNREMFINRVMLQTGIEIRVIDGMEANQLTWLAVRKPLAQAIKGFKRHNSLIIEVGAGNTELMVLQKGKITSAHSLPIGTLRFLQKLDRQFEEGTTDVRHFFRRHSSRIVKAISYELGLPRVSKLVAVGSDVRLAASRLGKTLTDDMSVIPRESFREFMNQVESMNAGQIMALLDVPISEAELLYPSLAILDTFIQATRADEILVPSSSIREGLLVNYASDRRTLQRIFATQVMAGVRSLAKHYRVDIKHAEFVRKQVLILYDTLNAELGLQSYNRIFLEAAALLHGTGSYISGPGRHKHSQYIIRHSSIFGLSQADREIIGHVVRYYRKAKPQKSHSLYMALSRDQKVTVQKLAALLRVAEALDQSHEQKVRIEQLEINSDRLIIYTSHPGDLSMEKLSLSEKGDLFEEIFGLQPILRFREPPIRKNNYEQQ